VCLATVAGALRELAIARDEPLRPLKVMVPVSLRQSEEAGALGNRITLAFVRLPLDEPDAHTRLMHVRGAAAAFKQANRPAGTEAVLGTLGLLPDSLRGVAARAVASPRVYNLTVSNVPGPPVPLYMLGAELLEAHPVVPIAERRSLAVGIFSHLEKLHFGLYADPEAFPRVSELPQALDVSLGQLLRPRELHRTSGRSRDRPLVASR
jgi:diacylglycerol O-acyltransferase